MPTLTLLGPQRLEPMLREEFDRQQIGGTVAVITAGWQEREAENDELQEHLGRQVIDLRLHSRADRLFAEDSALFAAHRARQDRLQEIQQIYRLRLSFTLDAARQLLKREGDAALLEPARAEAIEALRLLDRQHLERLAEIHQAYAAEWQPLERAAVKRQRDELAFILAGADAVGIAGGHVAVLLNRMRLFGLADLIRDKAIFAWSAGAMCLGPRVVLFHDSPPQGPGNAEVFEQGLGLYEGLVALPHAGARLRLHDPQRVSLFARRFGPDLCVALDSRVSIRREDGQWRAGANTRHLIPSGELVALEAAS